MSDPGAPPRHAAYPRALVTGAVLAGGRARRMGGRDKGLVEVAGRPMIAHVLAALRPQVGPVLVNANRNLDRYRALAPGAPVVSDAVGGYAGPLAGMASALAAAETPWVLVVPCDAPLLAPDLGPRLHAALARAGAALAVAHDGTRLQPVLALLSRDLLGDLRDALARGERKIDRWYAAHDVAVCDLSDRPDTFVNVNDPEERRRVGARLLAARAANG